MTPSLRGLGASINPGLFRQWRPEPDDDPSASNLGDLPGPAATEAGAVGGAVRRGRQAAWETGDVRGVAGGPATGGDRRELAGRCRCREEPGISWSPGSTAARSRRSGRRVLPTISSDTRAGSMDTCCQASSTCR
jgi:hypothetical protein